MEKKSQNLVVSILFLVLFIVSLVGYFSINSSYWLLLSILSISSAVFAFITYLYDLSERKQFLIVSLFFFLFGLMYFFSYLLDKNNNQLFWIAFSIFFAIFNFWHYLRAPEDQKKQETG